MSVYPTNCFHLLYFVVAKFTIFLRTRSLNFLLPFPIKINKQNGFMVVDNKEAVSIREKNLSIKLGYKKILQWFFLTSPPIYDFSAFHEIDWLGNWRWFKLVISWNAATVISKQVVFFYYLNLFWNLRGFEFDNLVLRSWSRLWLERVLWNWAAFRLWFWG